MALSSLESLAAAVAVEDDDIDLGAAALHIARLEYPDLDVDHYLGVLDEMGATARERLASAPDIGAKVNAFNQFMFEELGFEGDGADYYDPRNSYLNQVLDRRIGIPITLSLVYMEVGRRAGLSLEGVSFPGHFLVKLPVGNGMVILDPYAGGASLGISDLQTRLRQVQTLPPIGDMEQLLASASRREILGRMLRNLKSIYRKREDWRRVLEVLDRLLVIDPEQPEEVRDRGLAYGEMECFRAACTDLGRYLELEPEADDAGDMRSRMVDWQKRAARLN